MIRGSKQTTHLYLGDRVSECPGYETTLTLVVQWDLNANWEATYIWLPLIIDTGKKSLHIEWVDVYDLDV